MELWSLSRCTLEAGSSLLDTGTHQSATSNVPDAIRRERPKSRPSVSDVLSWCPSCHLGTYRLFCSYDLMIFRVWQEIPQAERNQSYLCFYLLVTTALIAGLSQKEAREYRTSLLAWGMLLTWRRNSPLTDPRSFVENLSGDVSWVLSPSCFHSGLRGSFLVGISGVSEWHLSYHCEQCTEKCWRKVKSSDSDTSDRSACSGLCTWLPFFLNIITVLEF